MLSFTFSLCCSCFAFSAVASPNGFYVLRKAFPVVYRTSSHVEIEAEGSFSDLSVGDINLNVTVASSSLEKKSSDPLRCERFLVLNRDYTIEKEANVLILGLLQNSRYVSALFSWGKKISRFALIFSLIFSLFLEIGPSRKFVSQHFLF